MKRPHKKTYTSKNRAAKTRREPEFLLQVSIIDALKKILSASVLFTAFPAGGGGRVRGAKLKRAGLNPGWPDIQFIARGKYYGMEVKTPKGRLSPAQRSLHQRLAENGCDVVVVRSVEEAMDAVNGWKLTRARFRVGTKTLESCSSTSSA